jgi:ABC-2 type transport system ATP-binding protein
MKFKGPNRAVLLTTHHLEEAEYLADEIILLSAGKIMHQGTVN